MSATVASVCYRGEFKRWEQRDSQLSMRYTGVTLCMWVPKGTDLGHSWGSGAVFVGVHGCCSQSVLEAYFRLYRGLPCFFPDSEESTLMRTEECLTLKSDTPRTTPFLSLNSFGNIQTQEGLK